VGGLVGCNLGLVHAHVSGELSARHVNVRLKAGVGVVGEEVPVATGVDEQHHAIGHAELSLIVVLGGPLLHGITQGILVFPLGPLGRVHGSVCHLERLEAKCFP
jgi:hypothetical protein